MERRKACIAIQMREGSTRCPLKCYAEIGGTQMYDYIYSRLEEAFGGMVDIWFLVPNKDLGLYDLLKDLEYSVFIDDTGTEDWDVLGRYTRFLNYFPQYQVVARYTADDPFRDTADLFALMAMMTCNPDLTVAFSRGLPYGMNNEVFSKEYLMKHNLNIGMERQSMREHIGYLCYDTDFSACINYDLPYSNIRVSVDTPQDLAFCQFVAQQCDIQKKEPLEIIRQLGKGS